MLSELLVQISQALSQARIPYMIIGGQAVMLYGERRLTKDIELTIGMDVDEDSVKLIGALAGKLGIKILPQDPLSFARKTMALPGIHQKSKIRVDFIFSNSIFEQQALRRRRAKRLKNRKVFFASVEDVIILKIIAGRPRDLEDMRRIMIKQGKLDYAYLKKWLMKFSSAPNADYWKTFQSLLWV